MRNITKKVISVLLLLTVALTSVAFAAYAAEEVTLSASLDAATRTLSVSGELPSTVTKANTTVILRYIKGTNNGTEEEEDWEYKNADNLLTEFTKTYYDAATGKIKFDFGGLVLPEDITPGMYRAEISCADFAKKVQYDHQYSKPEVVAASLEAVADATEATVFETLGENLKVLGLDATDYNIIAASSNSAGKAAFAAIMMDDAELYDDIAPEGTTDSVAIAEANKAVMAKLAAKVKEASAAGMFVIITGESGFDSWFAKYVKADGIENANAVIEALPFEEDSDKSREDIFALVRDEAEFIRRIVLADGEMTLDEIRTYITEHALLTRIVTGTATEIATMLEGYNEMFAADGDSLDWSDYEGLDPTIQSEVISAVKGKSYDDMKEAVKKLNTAIGADYDSGDDDDGGSRGSSKSSSKSVYMPNTPITEEVEETVLFTDLDESHWAYDEIIYLFAKKIVNGNPDGTFAPENNVTRAEFIKMIAAAMGMEAESSATPFKDVAQDSWYAPYIAAAYNSGILTGDENGMCHPEANITRQDMATILYRAVAAEYKGGAPAFTDAAEISDYAKDAVAYFAQEGVINGLGDGRFGPHENATRAQTAAIICRIVRK